MLPESLLDEAVLRVLQLKNDLGLFENPCKDASEEDEQALHFCEAHQALSREAAEETLRESMSREDYAIVSGEEGFVLRSRLVELWGELANALR